MLVPLVWCTFHAVYYLRRLQRTVIALRGSSFLGWFFIFRWVPMGPVTFGWLPVHTATLRLLYVAGYVSFFRYGSYGSVVRCSVGYAVTR